MISKTAARLDRNGPKGTVVITDGESHSETFKAGDCFVVPKGRKGDTITAALHAAGKRYLAPPRKFHEPRGPSGSFIAGHLATVDGVVLVTRDRAPDALPGGMIVHARHEVFAPYGGGRPAPETSAVTDNASAITDDASAPSRPATVPESIP